MCVVVVSAARGGWKTVPLGVLCMFPSGIYRKSDASVRARVCFLHFWRRGRFSVLELAGWALGTAWHCAERITGASCPIAATVCLVKICYCCNKHWGNKNLNTNLLYECCSLNTERMDELECLNRLNAGMECEWTMQMDADWWARRVVYVEKSQFGAFEMCFAAPNGWLFRQNGCVPGVLNGGS